MRKVLLLLVILSGFFITTGCSQEVEGQVSLSPKETVTKFFEYRNDKDLEKMEQLLSDDRHGVSWQLESLNSIQILSIEEDTTGKMKEDFIAYGLGKNFEKSNISVFKVEFEVDYQGGFGSGLDNGVHSWWYYLTRDSESSPWKIDDWGY
ncbi:DUF4829 domain-containing protein [Anaerobacillus alkaliphilus]|uniref:DUF4829 domain-containing protein n=1 Tax=Anaerobacillus alkaliphilus TaxID=1548597 RepID=UPI001375C48A|nr:DUF4829 domain-containing protein [Anaerobacillus alkaliphilus]